MPLPDGVPKSLAKVWPSLYEALLDPSQLAKLQWKDKDEQAEEAAPPKDLQAALQRKRRLEAKSAEASKRAEELDEEIKKLTQQREELQKLQDERNGRLAQLDAQIKAFQKEEVLGSTVEDTLARVCELLQGLGLGTKSATLQAAGAKLAEAAKAAGAAAQAEAEQKAKQEAGEAGAGPGAAGPDTYMDPGPVLPTDDIDELVSDIKDEPTKKRMHARLSSYSAEQTELRGAKARRGL